ncbi:acetyltransferase, CysE/LacA/LpxA/NodL family [Novosphingobium nitrogenifigens DSM 19370]|uniref:Acetyltransferase, CysE/LacA/LpxA/NodL family n=1 Tax=Novosphingobium nitrogenifigens DSM 19370 TaxID=983920 RepID=F1ZDV8_9SPHN|nr:acetyltransferase [Novosphingobium nitrogenifigens]EGD57205.1 acetyltransferase, CysE/LacA/LpxA/NodL family [Novosphingobium nitrogenifigens DSM 19370]
MGDVHKPLDAESSASREGGPSFSLRNRIERIVWQIAWAVLASWTPPQARGWRRFLLRAFGAKVGRGANIYSSATIWHPVNLELGEGATIGPRVRIYNQGRISIGAETIVSQGAYLCASGHDYNDQHFQLELRPIHVGAGCWIATDAFVGPGVTIGDGAVLAARAVAVRDIDPWTICGGNPAQPIKPRPRG